MNYRINCWPVGAPPPPPPAVAPLSGQYIVLEPLMKAADADFGELFAASHGDARRQELWEFLPYGPFADAAAMAQFYRRQGATGDPQFYLVRHVTGQAAGVVSYLRIAPPAYSVEIGHIWHAVDAQRGRANTEAAYLLMNNAFALGYRRLEWKCDAMNMRSRLAALRLGLAFEGVFRQCTVSKGNNRDTAWFAILNQDWPAVRENMQAWLDAPLGAVSLAEKNRPLVEWSLPAHKRWPAGDVGMAADSPPHYPVVN